MEFKELRTEMLKTLYGGSDIMFMDYFRIVNNTKLITMLNNTKGCIINRIMENKNDS